MIMAKLKNLVLIHHLNIQLGVKLIGHIVISAMLINEGCKKIPDFPK